MSRLYKIDAAVAGRIAIAARPRGGGCLKTDVGEWKNAAVNLAVSLLECHETFELGLQQEDFLCRSNGIEFVSFPIADHGVPGSWRETARVARSLARAIRGGRSVAVHCRAGIGRSSLFAACVLICCGTEPEKALSLITAARGLVVPETEQQRDWVTAFALAASPARRGG